MKKSYIRIGLAGMLVIGLTAGYASAQGSLTPPGTPSPTMKTLEQVEPRTDLSTVAGDATYHHVISQSGSYYLSSNLAVTNTSGIHINAVGVTLDLNGFEISRISGIGLYGIHIAGGMDRATVRNGTIHGFSCGIRSDSSPDFATGCLFERLTVSDCYSWGIVAGTAARIVDCCAHDNTYSGIYAMAGSSLSGCTASFNAGYGIYVREGSSLSECAATGNFGTAGIYTKEGCTLILCAASSNKGIGIYAGWGSSLESCTAHANQGDYGIYGLQGCSLTGCSASGNEGKGIAAELGSTLSTCSAESNDGMGIYLLGSGSLSGCAALSNGDTGIFVSGTAVVNKCTARFNTNRGIYAGEGSLVNLCTASDNRGYGLSSGGIYVAANSMVIGCTSTGNINTNNPSTALQGTGVFAGDGSTIKDCIVADNLGDGIRVGSETTVEGNTCRRNGTVINAGAGIIVTGNFNRVENNSIINNSRGLVVEAEGNLIVRNSSSTDNPAFIYRYVIAPGNHLGTIQTNQVGTGAWDNFEFFIPLAP